jgi:hypothetical protein
VVAVSIRRICRYLRLRYSPDSTGGYLAWPEDARPQSAQPSRDSRPAIALRAGAGLAGMVCRKDFPLLGYFCCDGEASPAARFLDVNLIRFPLHTFS